MHVTHADGWPTSTRVELARGRVGAHHPRPGQGSRHPRCRLRPLLDRGLLERIAHGVYRIRGAGEPDHLQLRAAWLQLDPGRSAWERLDEPDVAVVSHASAASLYGVGDLRPDVHEFTAPRRWQTRRKDVRVHRGTVLDSEKTLLKGLPDNPGRKMIDVLLTDHVDPEAIARITVQVLENLHDYPREIALRVAPFAASFGLPSGDGVALLEHLLDLAGGVLDRETILEMARP